LDVIQLGNNVVANSFDGSLTLKRTGAGLKGFVLMFVGTSDSVTIHRQQAGSL
jgi:galactokinase/mevalonate kinase-like predicted kinase